MKEPTAPLPDFEYRQNPAIRTMMLPNQTNAVGTIFGGVILSYIDLAGAVPARARAPYQYVTVAMKEVIFHEPVYVGDIVSFYADITRIGRTSITVHVLVEASRMREGGKIVRVTEADVIYVALGDDGKPTPILPDYK